MIHSTLHDSSRNTTSLSFVAFERSIEAGLDRLETEVSYRCGHRCRMDVPYNSVISRDSRV
jgi:hypothetical protein